MEDRRKSLIKNIANKVIEEMSKNELVIGDISWVLSSVEQEILKSTPIKEIKVLSDKYQKLIVETEDTKEILAEITADDIKSAYNIQVRLATTYDD